MKNIYLILVLFFVFVHNVKTQCWEERLKLEDDFGLFEIVFIDQFGVAIGAKGEGVTAVILRTLNGGQDWEEIYLPDLICCVELDMTPDSTIFVASGSMYIYKSTNLGDDWEVLNNPVEGIHKEVLDIKFVSQDTGWVNIKQKGVYRTTDGGETWEPKLTGYTGMRDLYLLDGQRTFVVGTYIRYTLDGGDTWVLLGSQINSSYHVRKIQFLNDMLGYAIGLSDKIYKTVDGGITWEGINTGIEDPFPVSELFFVDDSTGFISSVIGHDIYVTRDSGLSWKPMGGVPLVEGIESIYMHDVNHGYVVTYDGYLLEYKNEIPPSCHVRNTTPALLPSLYPEITWELELDFEGCLDGFELRLRDQFGAYRDTIDVGLVYSYQVESPVASAAWIILEIVPYSNTWGYALTCSQLQNTVITEECQALPLPIDTFICQGEAFVWDGHVFDETGFYEINYLDDYSCDSTITLNLNWYEPPVQTIIDTTLVTGGTFNGAIYEEDAIFTELYPAATGCDSIVTYVISIITNTEEPRDHNIWRVFPNPMTADWFYLLGKEKWQEATLYDTNGRQVQTWKGDYVPGRNRLELKPIQSGVYFLVIQNESGVWTERVVLM